MPWRNHPEMLFIDYNLTNGINFRVQSRILHTLLCEFIHLLNNFVWILFFD